MLMIISPIILRDRNTEEIKRPSNRSPPSRLHRKTAAWWWWWCLAFFSSRLHGQNLFHGQDLKAYQLRGGRVSRPAFSLMWLDWFHLHFASQLPDSQLWPLPLSPSSIWWSARPAEEPDAFREDAVKVTKNCVGTTQNVQHESGNRFYWQIIWPLVQQQNFFRPCLWPSIKVSIIYFSKIKVTISKMTIKILNVYNKGSQTYNIHIFHFATTVGHKTPPLQTSRFPVTVARQ